MKLMVAFLPAKKYVVTVGNTAFFMIILILYFFSFLLKFDFFFWGTKFMQHMDMKSKQIFLR